VACSVFAARIKGVLGSVVLGSIAGLNFASAAIAARPLAGSHSVAEFVLNPLLYLVIAHSLTGQLLLGLAMQRGSTNAAVAGMDAAGAVPAAVLGLVLLGDQMRPGLEWLAVIGFVVTLGAVIALTRYAEPQHELASEPVPIPLRHRSAVVPGLPPHPARGVAECETVTSSPARTHPTIVLQRPLRRPQQTEAASGGTNGHAGAMSGHGSPKGQAGNANGHEPSNGQAAAVNGHGPADGQGGAASRQESAIKGQGTADGQGGATGRQEPAIKGQDTADGQGGTSSRQEPAIKGQGTANGQAGANGHGQLGKAATEAVRSA
jgi:hypothetical protein